MHAIIGGAELRELLVREQAVLYRTPLRMLRILDDRQTKLKQPDLGCDRCS